MGIQQQIGIPPMPTVMRILAGFDRPTLEAFMTVAVELMDIADGDPDLESATDLEDDHALSRHAIGYDTGPGCEVSDNGENTWVEWDKMRGAQKTGHNQTAGQEDDEDDDPDCGLDEGEPNFVAVNDGNAGCPIADPGGCQHDGREPDTDAEIEQMAHDVPAFPVFALEPNIFNDKRAFLGMNAGPGFIDEPLPAA